MARAGMTALLLATALGLSGCGITYVSPLIRENANDGVTVVPITQANLLSANSSPYTPRALPAAFDSVAGGGTVGGASSGLPPAPVVPDLTPGRLELRPPPSAETQRYRIGVGDIVELATRSAVASDLQSVDVGQVAADGGMQRNQFTVRDDGSIGIPNVGTTMVQGLTIDEAEQALFQRFVDAGLDPDFTLEVTGFNSQRVTVGGDVSSPAAVPVTLSPPTLDEALTAAGGLRVTTPEYASIRIYRDGSLYTIPYTNYLSDGDLRSIRLAAGDSIFVDSSYDLDRALDYYSREIQIAGLRRSDRTAALSELQAEIAVRRDALAESRSNFESRLELGAEARDYVYLSGEVNQQSRYPLPFGQTASLADALFDGGGFDSATGNPSQIYVLRLSSDPNQAEPVTAWHLDARNAANLTLATRFELRPDDIIFVEEQPITRWNRAFQQFFPSLLSSAGDAVN